MADMFNKDGVLHFNYQAQDLAPAEAEARVKLEKDLAALIAIPQAERTFENTIMGSGRRESGRPRRWARWRVR